MPAPKKKAAPKKKPAAKPAPSKQKAAPKAKSKSTQATYAASSPVGKTADSALKLVDQAADLLRKGIREGASQTDRARLASKRQALSLVNKASTQLSKLISKI